MTTTKKRPVFIQARTQGQYFATYGAVQAATGDKETLWVGTDYGYGSTEPALRDARAWLADHPEFFEIQSR